jgi:hypothetical protein
VQQYEANVKRDVMVTRMKTTAAARLIHIRLAAAAAVLGGLCLEDQIGIVTAPVLSVAKPFTKAANKQENSAIMPEKSHSENSDPTRRSL